MKKRIGILGGTFDPVHNAHLYIAEQAAKKLRLREVLMMVSKTPAYKTGSRVITPEEYRATMVRLACEGSKKLVFSDFELRREGNTYTADTLRILKENAPDTEIFFMLGYDSLSWVDRWYHAEEVLKNCVLVPFIRGWDTEEKMREKIRELEENFGARIRPVYQIPPDVSSTKIRTLVREGKSIRGLVPEKVEQYILDNRLYLDDGEDA